MEWVLFVLILAFGIWIFQMIVAFRRAVRRYDEQIEQVQGATRETTEQADRHTAEQDSRTQEIAEARKELEEAESREKEVQARLAELKAAEAAHRPTRHKIEGLSSEDAG